MSENMIIAIADEGDIARGYKTQIRRLLNDVCAVVDDAQRAGFEVEFGINSPKSGNSTVSRLNVLKRY